MQLIFTDLYKGYDRDNFLAKVIHISNNLGINPNWLMAVMKSESTLNPRAVNKQPSSVAGYDGYGDLIKPKGTPDSDNAYTRSLYRATGLIQFMPRTAVSLGTTTADIYNMSGVDQLNYVYKYYLPYKDKLKSYYDLYLVTFFPAAIGKPDEWVFQTSNIAASKIAQANPGINSNKDKKITIAEFKRYIQRTIPDNLKQFVFELTDATAQVAKKKSTWIIFTAIAAVILYNQNNKQQFA